MNIDLDLISTQVSKEVMEKLADGSVGFFSSLVELIDEKEFERPHNCGVAAAKVIFETLRYIDIKFVQDKHHGKILIAFVSMFLKMMQEFGIEFYGIANEEDVKPNIDKVFIAKPSEE